MGTSPHGDLPITAVTRRLFLSFGLGHHYGVVLGPRLARPAPTLAAIDDQHRDPPVPAGSRRVCDVDRVVGTTVATVHGGHQATSLRMSLASCLSRRLMAWSLVSSSSAALAASRISYRAQLRYMRPISTARRSFMVNDIFK